MLNIFRHRGFESDFTTDSDVVLVCKELAS
jgi:hypothetical protein